MIVSDIIIVHRIVCVCSNPIRAWHFIQVHNANTFLDLNFSLELFLLLLLLLMRGLQMIKLFRALKRFT